VAAAVAAAAVASAPAQFGMKLLTDGFGTLDFGSDGRSRSQPQSPFKGMSEVCDGASRRTHIGSTRKASGVGTAHGSSHRGAPDELPGKLERLHSLDCSRHCVYARSVDVTAQRGGASGPSADADAVHRAKSHPNPRTPRNALLEKRKRKNCTGIESFHPLHSWQWHGRFEGKAPTSAFRASPCCADSPPPLAPPRPAAGPGPAPPPWLRRGLWADSWW